MSWDTSGTLQFAPTSSTVLVVSTTAVAAMPPVHDVRHRASHENTEHGKVQVGCLVFAPVQYSVNMLAGLTIVRPMFGFSSSTPLSGVSGSWTGASDVCQVNAKEIPCGLAGLHVGSPTDAIHGGCDGPRPVPRSASALCCRPLLAPVPLSPVVLSSRLHTAGTDGGQGTQSPLPCAAKVDMQPLNSELYSASYYHSDYATHYNLHHHQIHNTAVTTAFTSNRNIKRQQQTALPLT